MNQNKPEDESLNKALGAWHVTTSLPPRFQEKVWSRIEQAENVRISSFWEQASAWMNQLFAKPTVAVGYVAMLLIVGLMAGHLKANTKQSELRSELSARYVQAVDPYGKLEP